MRHDGIHQHIGRLAVVISSMALVALAARAASDATVPTTVSFVAPTSSAEGPACSGQYLCLWTKSDMRSSSGWSDKLTPSSTGGCQPLTKSSRSGANNLKERVTLYGSTDCRGGEKVVLEPGSARADFGFAARSVRTELKSCS